MDACPQPLWESFGQGLPLIFKGVQWWGIYLRRGTHMARGGILRGGHENFTRGPPLFGRLCGGDEPNFAMDSPLWSGGGWSILFLPCAQVPSGPHHLNYTLQGPYLIGGGGYQVVDYLLPCARVTDLGRDHLPPYVQAPNQG